jgi:hypothetical protein
MATELDQFTERQLEVISPLLAASHSMQEAANEIQIANDDELTAANHLKKALNSHTKAVKELRLELTRPLDDVTKQLIAKEREILAPVEAGKSVLSDKILRYTDEQERRRVAEEARVDEIVARIQSNFKPGMTKSQVETAREAGKRIVSEMPAADGAIPRVKLAVLTLSNNLKARATDIEIEEQRAKKQKLQADEQRVEDERRALEARKEEQRLKEAQLEADKAAAREEAARPKSNIVESTDFEVIDESAVDPLLKTTDMKKVREYHKAYPDREIAGIRITKTRRAR